MGQGQGQLQGGSVIDLQNQVKTAGQAEGPVVLAGYVQDAQPGGDIGGLLIIHPDHIHQVTWEKVPSGGMLHLHRQAHGRYSEVVNGARRLALPSRNPDPIGAVTTHPW